MVSGKFEHGSVGPTVTPETMVSPELAAVLAVPMELDTHFLPEVTHILRRLPEAIHNVEDVMPHLIALVPPGGRIDEKRKRFFTALYAHPDTMVLKDGKFYLSRPVTETGRIPNEQRAEAVIDRIAELVDQSRRRISVEDAIQRVKQEGKLLLPYPNTYTVAEEICRLHPRLKTVHHSSQPGVELIKAVKPSETDWPKVIGEAVDRLIANSNKKTAFDAVHWLDEVWPSDLQITLWARRAFTLCLQQHPRFKMETKQDGTKLYRLVPEIGTSRRRVQPQRQQRRADAPPGKPVSVRPRPAAPEQALKVSSDQKWEPLRSVEEARSRSLQELAKRALDQAGTHDLRSIERLIRGITVSSVSFPEDLRADVADVLLWDPRVRPLDSNEKFAVIHHTPEDAVRYDTLRLRVAQAISSLQLSNEMVTLSVSELQAKVRGFTRKRGVKLSDFEQGLLNRLIQTNPQVSMLPTETGKPEEYRLAKVTTPASIRSSISTVIARHVQAGTLDQTPTETLHQETGEQILADGMVLSARQSKEMLKILVTSLRTNRAKLRFEKHTALSQDTGDRDDTPQSDVKQEQPVTQPEVEPEAERRPEPASVSAPEPTDPLHETVTVTPGVSAAIDRVAARHIDPYMLAMPTDRIIRLIREALSDADSTPGDEELKNQLVASGKFSEDPDRPGELQIVQEEPPQQLRGQKVKLNKLRPPKRRAHTVNAHDHRTHLKDMTIYPTAPRDEA